MRDSGIFLVIPSEAVHRSSQVRTRYSARAVKGCGHAHIGVCEGALAGSSVHGFMPGTAFYENATSPAQRTPLCRAWLRDSATSYRTFDETSSCISYAKSISTQNQPCNKDGDGNSKANLLFIHLSSSHQNHQNYQKF